VLDINELIKVIPHRYPFLLIDRITCIDGAKITAIKNVTINEPFFQGHFPGHPVMPGVLQLEAIAQTAGVLTLKKPGNAGKLAYLTGAENVKFRRTVIPGDVLTIDVEIVRDRQKICKAQGYCRVEGKIASQALVTFALVAD
jgi:UDP-3-O-[3-hydroxymyristoyl] N-acetylglucosamine deacetylase/3-hydroxyacyl-[acyl-carrier-protein] dehydratase